MNAYTVGRITGAAAPYPVSRGKVYFGPEWARDRGEWEPGTYEARDVVTHNGSTWKAWRRTSVEPTESVPDDWNLLLDGTPASGAVDDAVGIVRGGVETSFDTLEKIVGNLPSVPVPKPGVAVARALRDYLGDGLNLASLVPDAGNASLAFNQLMDAFQLAVSLDRPLIASRNMPVIEIGGNKLVFPSGLKMFAEGRPIRVHHTSSLPAQTSDAEDLTIRGLRFIGEHDLATGNRNEYSCQFINCEDVDLDVSFVNGNSGLLLTDCRNAKSRVYARNMVANGCGVKGWDCKSIELEVDVLNALGFGLYGSDGGSNVHVRSLYKRYDESVMTPYLLSERAYNLFQWGGTPDSANNVWRYHLGLEGMGLTVWTANWTVDYARIDRTADNGISLSGDHNRVRSGLITDCRHDGVHSYGQTNDAHGVTSRGCGYRSSTNGSAITGYGFNASGSAGGTPYEVTFSQCRSEGNIRGDFNLDGGTFTDIWQSGGTPTRQFCYWEDASWGYVFYSGGATPGAFGTTSPAAAGWAFNPLVNASLQLTWNDGVTTWRYRCRVPVGGGPFAARCVIDATCIATHPNSALRFINAAPANAGNFIAAGGGANALKVPKADVTLGSDGVLTHKANGSNATERPVLEFYRGNGSYELPTDVAAGSILGEMRASGFIGGAKQLGAYLRSVVGIVSGGQIRPSWIFFYKDGNNIIQEGLRIHYDGSLWAAAYGHSTEQSIGDADVVSGAVTINHGNVAANFSTATTINRINSALNAAFMTNIRNTGTSPITIAHATATIRLNGGANVILNQYQSISLRRVGNSGAIWQQI